MNNISLHHFIKHKQLQLLTLLIVCMFVFLIVLVSAFGYLQIKHSTTQNAEQINDALRSYFSFYLERMEEYHQNQAIRSLISYCHSTKNCDPQTMYAVANDLNLPPDTIICTSTQQIWPFDEQYSGEMPLQLYKISSQTTYYKNDILYFAIPYYNFVHTKQLGIVCFRIAPSSIANCLQQALPDTVSYKIMDSFNHCFIQSASQSLFSFSVNQDGGYICSATFSDCTPTVKMASIICGCFFLICIVAYVVARKQCARVASTIATPIQQLINSFQSKQNGHLISAISQPQTNIAEIFDLVQAYTHLMEQITVLINQNQKNNLLRMESQLDALQMKINPHFLFNTLEIISSQAVMEDAWKTEDMLQRLGTLFRYSLRAPNIIDLQQEYQYAENYLFLQNIRLNNKVEYHCEMDPILFSVSLPKLILQPILENCFQHAFPNNPEYRMKILIRSVHSEKMLQISVTDNGIGILQSKIEQIEKEFMLDSNDFSYFIHRNSHIGLRNINARLCLFFNIDRAVWIERLPEGGTHIIIRIPWSTVFQEDNGNAKGFGC